MKHEIHISDIRTFRQCRRRWYFSSPLSRNLEPRVPYAPFFTGRCIHKALEKFYESGAHPVMTALDFVDKEMEQWGSLWESQQQLFDQQIELITGMLSHYMLWRDRYVNRFQDSNLEFLAMETEFEVPLRNDNGRSSTKVFLAGRFDGVVVNKKDGSYWLWEVKTARSIDELYQSLRLDEQCGTYIYAAREVFGVPIAGVLYNIMRKKTPTIPRVLNNGTLSKATNIDTTAAVYLNTVKEVHPDWSPEQILEEYGEILQHLLNNNEAKFFARVPIYRTDSEIDTLVNFLWQTALEMTRSNTPLYPSPGWGTCNFCSFMGPCVAMSAGKDYEFILEQEFRSRIPETSNEKEED